MFYISNLGNKQAEKRERRGDASISSSPILNQTIPEANVRAWPPRATVFVKPSRGSGEAGLKTVLVVTTDVKHRALYECGLEGYVRTRFSPESDGGDGGIDAFIYDVIGPFDEIDRLWLEGTEIPVIVLTSEGRIPLPHSRKRRVLNYPASLEEIFRALQQLGIAEDSVVSR